MSSMKNPLSQKLLKERVSNDFTQKVFAEKIGVSYAVYVGIENGSYEASLKILTKIAIYFGLDTSEIVALYLDDAENIKGE